MLLSICLYNQLEKYENNLWDFLKIISNFNVLLVTIR